MEQNPDQKLLAAIMALEVLIGDDTKGPKKFRMARRHAFLTCSIPLASMCGRDRSSCPYLALDPDKKVDAKVLTGLCERSRQDVRVVCSEYRRMIDLYDARTLAVHDGTVGADLKTVRNGLYPMYRWLIPRLYGWFASHQDDDDLRQLDAEIVRVARERPPDPIPEL